MHAKVQLKTQAIRLPLRQPGHVRTLVHCASGWRQVSAELNADAHRGTTAMWSCKWFAYSWHL